jgi:hypothetical protein
MNDFSGREAPPIGGKVDEGLVVQWAMEHIDYLHPLRRRDERRWHRAERYDGGDQRLRQAYGALGGMTQWVEAEFEDGEIPQPVFNEGLGARVNESARLGRPNYQPIVRTKGTSPSLAAQEAAMARQRMMRHRLRKQGWSTEEDLLTLHMPLYGGAFVGCEWEQRWDEVRRVPIAGAVTCKPCKVILASPSLSPAHVQRLGSTLVAQNALAAGLGEWTLNGCPKCGNPMTEFKPSIKEAQIEKDAVGRSLGEEQPLGDWRFRVRSPHDVFLPNHGLDMRPDDLYDFTEAHVERLDWFATRYPEVARGVQAENPAAMAMFHPIAGAPDMHSSAIDGRTYRNCARAIERHKAPWPEWDGKRYKLNEGRTAVVANRKVLYYGPSLIKSPSTGKKVPRCRMNYIRWEFLAGGRRLHGQSLWDIIFDAQDNANESRGQRSAVRQRMAVPIVVSDKESNLEIKALGAGIPGMHATVQVGADRPYVEPKVINNVTIDPGVNVEIQDSTDYIQRATRNTNIESGMHEPGADTASQTKLLKTSSGEIREEPIRRIREGLRPLMQLACDYMGALYIEPRECSYEDEDAGGDETWEEYGPRQLAAELDFVVELEPDEEPTEEKRLKVKDWLTTGLVDPTTADPRLKRKIARDLGAPDDMFDDEDAQEAEAQREAVRYRKARTNPVVDPSLDSHPEHWREHGRFCRTPWFREMEKIGEWDRALAVLEPDWHGIIQAAAYTPGRGSLQERILDLWQQILAAAQEMDEQGFPLQVDPKTGQFLGQPLYVAPPTPEAQASLEAVLIWRAHMEAHQAQEAQKQARAMMQPVLAAPGGPQTPEGTQVTPGAPEEQQAMMPGPAVAQPGMAGAPVMPSL